MDSLIPKIIETNWSRRTMGSLVMPEGSPWCDGKPMLWFTGHCYPEFRFCENDDGEFDLKLPNPPLPGIDRHGCTSFDVNKDGLVDLICTRGGGQGTATENDNQVHLTQEDGSLQQIFNHGLESPTRRSYDFIAFKSATGDDLVFEQVFSNDRKDGLLNKNQLYKWVPQQEDGKYFVEIPGPWGDEQIQPHTVKMVDIDGDGKLDIFIHAKQLDRKDRQNRGRNIIKIYLQRKNNRFFESNVQISRARYESVAIADLNGDGQPDVVGYDSRKKLFHILWNTSKDSKLNVLFTRTIKVMKNYTKKYAAGNHYVGGIAVLDVNGDGLMDIFVSQSLDEIGEYCSFDIRGGYPAVRKRFGIVKGGKYNDDGLREENTFVPPSDEIPDLLFINKGNWRKQPYPQFHAKELNLNLKGCAGKQMDSFGEKKLAISKSSLSYPGRFYILDWS